jgi:ornithine cyclodeaminase
MLPQLARIAAELGLPFEAVDLPRMIEADVIVTITSSPAFSLASAHVAPGTHLACMGTDTVGKQEVEPALLARATVFTDEVAQSVSIGEAQHAVGAGLLTAGDITPLGNVIIGAHSGRRSPDEITLFDGTGVGLQDLAVAAMAVTRARERGLGVEVAV